MLVMTYDEPCDAYTHFRWIAIQDSRSPLSAWKRADEYVEVKSGGDYCEDCCVLLRVVVEDCGCWLLEEEAWLSRYWRKPYRD
jgi:hypothetical protein